MENRIGLIALFFMALGMTSFSKCFEGGHFDVL